MTPSSAQPDTNKMLMELDAGLRRSVDRFKATHNGLWDMAAYAMGWSGEGAGPETTGKRIRRWPIRPEDLK